LAAGCLLLLVAPLRAEAPDRSKAIDFLVKLQNKDGGFRPSADDEKSSLRATSSAVRALHYLGGELPNRAECVKFVDSCFDKASGGFADVPGGKPDVTVTAVGLMAVAELKMDADKYVGPAVKYLDENARGFEDLRIAVAGFEAVNRKPAQTEAWIEQIKKEANPDGTFGKGDGQARQTASGVVILMRLGQQPLQPTAVLKVLGDGLREDGAYGKADAKGSDLESTYRVLRAFHMLQTMPQGADKIAKFIDSCQNADGGYGVAPGQPSTAAGTYYAAIGTQWLKKK